MDCSPFNISLSDSLCLPFAIHVLSPDWTQSSTSVHSLTPPVGSTLGPCLLVAVPSGIVQCFTVFTLWVDCLQGPMQHSKTPLLLPVFSTSRPQRPLRYTSMSPPSHFLMCSVLSRILCRPFIYGHTGTCWVSAFGLLSLCGYLFHFVNVAGPLLGLQWVKSKGDGGEWGVAICKVES